MIKTLHVVAVAAAAAIMAPGASGQQYPVKPIRMVIGFAPGGGTDIVGRIVAQKLSEALAQQVMPDNRGGAAGQIGTEIVARAAPDGYTLLMAHIAALSILPSLVPKLPYDPERDFAPISLVAIAPNLLVVHPSLQVTTVRGLIQLGRAHPGKLRFASPGAGSVQHLAGELFKLQAKVDMLHVPYKGSGQSTIDLIAGQVHLDFDSVPPVIGHVRSGKLRALAVTSAKRFALLPAIPTISESGLQGFDMSTWWGLVVPAGASKEVVAKLNGATLKLLHQNDVKETMANVGAEIVGTTPENFASFIRSERDKYARIVKDANIKIE
ncbi:MAG TPA: tripartite tricarboxylate transporter substrate binding protein [Burkholderiales bacterium]|nr:tripartite tricarboxylate transporter substrate binding protein [Burkholderiales bacterium]